MTTQDHAKIARQIAELDDMTVGQLQKRWEEVWQEPCRSRNKDHLKKRIAWRIQALVLGGLSQRALDRAKELADDTLLRICPGRTLNIATGHSKMCVEKAIHSFAPAAVQSDRLLPGSVLTRDYQGRKLLVSVLENGFEFKGKIYRSLSAVAKVATGAHWNGRLFFGLTKAGKEAA